VLQERSLEQKCFRWRRKDCNDVMETRLSGSAFQILAAATGIARLPTLADRHLWQIIPYR